MTNTIDITACDNELYIIAYNTTQSYQLAHILSGNGEPVNASFSLLNGTYQTTATLNSVCFPLTGPNSNPMYGMATLPGGTYTLIALGINWGGPASFAVSVNGTPLSGTTSQGEGLVWTPQGVTITI